MSYSKGVTIVCLLSIVGIVTATKFQCERSNGDIQEFPRQVCYIKKCALKIEEHIKEELHAAFYYMYLAARFDDDSVDRPGLAKFLYESASEERQHAMLMLDYLNTRGIAFNKKYEFGTRQMKKLVQKLQPVTASNSEPTQEINVSQKLAEEIQYATALDIALTLEIDVTKKIYDVVVACADDFHSADVFTDPILTEQHDGLRKLQGAIKTFRDLTQGHTDNTDELALAEYIFDRKLLSGDL